MRAHNVNTIMRTCLLCRMRAHNVNTIMRTCLLCRRRLGRWWNYGAPAPPLFHTPPSVFNNIYPIWYAILMEVYTCGPKPANIYIYIMSYYGAPACTPGTFSTWFVCRRWPCLSAGSAQSPCFSWSFWPGKDTGGTGSIYLTHHKKHTKGYWVNIFNTIQTIGRRAKPSQGVSHSDANSWKGHSGYWVNLFLTPSTA